MDPFAEPDAIRPNVEFWTRVFSEWSVTQVAVHDMERPELVYEVVDLPGKPEDRYTDDQQEFVEDLRESWENFLQDLEKKVAHRKQLDDIEKQWVLHIADLLGGDGLEGAHERVRTQRGLRERFRGGIERSFRYDTMMRDIFRQAGLPEDLVFMAHVESSFESHARSSAGATGIWQFTRSTGRRYLTINSAIDERLDPIAATRGAADYLRDAYDKLGSWPLAVTAYNHGVQGMVRAKEHIGDDFEKIFKEYRGRLFGFASKNFYAEFLAARRIAGDPDRFFPEGYEPAPPLDHDEIVLDHRTTPGLIAKHYGTRVEELAAINPAWTRRAVRSPLKLPAGTHVWLPKGSAGSAGAAPLQAPTHPNGWIDEDGFYVVRRGDTLSTIAEAHGVSLKTLRSLNGLPANGHLIRPGQKLRLGPDAVVLEHVVRRGDTLSGIARAYGTRVSALRAANGFPSRKSEIYVGQKLKLPPDAIAPPHQEHVVRSGDTLTRIASMYGVKLMDLLSANTLSMQSIIHPGQILRIPH